MSSASTSPDGATSSTSTPSLSTPPDNNNTKDLGSFDPTEPLSPEAATLANLHSSTLDEEASSPDNPEAESPLGGDDDGAPATVIENGTADVVLNGPSDDVVQNGTTEEGPKSPVLQNGSGTDDVTVKSPASPVVENGSETPMSNGGPKYELLGDETDPELRRLAEEVEALMHDAPGTTKATKGPRTPHKSVRVHAEKERVISEAHLLNQVQKLCRVIDLHLGAVSYEKYISAAHAATTAARVKEQLGFSLELRPSGMAGGGQGVFVSGTVPAKALVAFYPGTVYKGGDTVLIQSLANAFVFQCQDGALLDASNRGLSKMIFTSCSFRDRYGHLLMSDLTWLNPARANPLALGHFVNNHSNECPANVVYQEADLPLAHFLPNLRRYIPNCLYNSTLLGADETDPRMRLVLLCSLREIADGEELLSSYFTLIT